MDSSKSLSYFFRKHSSVRWLSAILVIAAVLSVVFFVGRRSTPVPEIESINPPVGSPGDVIVIRGKNFGDVRDMSYVEFSGSRLTASSYISWADDCIKLVLPTNIRDGLVYVGTKDARSKPALFANEVDIPVPVPVYVQTTSPEIRAVSAGSAAVGELITITGVNFGESRNESKVLFTVDYNNQLRKSVYVNRLLQTKNMIAAEETDYVSWSNSEIQVRVPDGAYSGVIIIDNGKEKSEPFEFKVNAAPGEKLFVNKKIYLLQYSADISDLVTTDVSTITLRCPLPKAVPQQPEIELTEVQPSPILENYQGCLIHQITKNRNNSPKSVFTQIFVLPVYEVNSSLNVEKIPSSYKNMNQELYKKYTAADEFVPAEDGSVVALSKEIVGNEKNPYKKAKLIYDYMIENYKLLDKVRKDTENPLDLIKKSRASGDAYDFAVIYTALCRAAGIPCQVDCGILIGQDLISQNHWWSEFYVPSVGWLPVDVALASGLKYKRWPDVTDDKAYYFGNMDSHHVLFSRGWNKLKPFSQNNKIVQYPKSFALQTIWEEASSDTTKYSSYWSLPVVKGVY